MNDVSGYFFLTNIPGGRDETLTATDRYWKLHGVEGPPGATDAYTSEELRRMGYVGLYDPRRNPDGSDKKAGR